MSVRRRDERRRRLPVLGAALVLAAVPVAGCAEVESAAVDGYHPSKVREVEGSEVKQVTLTREGAERTGLRTATVRAMGGRRVVPYAALVYDGQGVPYVYESTGRLRFVRAKVTVDRIE